jgi:adenylyl-sulfate kinase
VIDPRRSRRGAVVWLTGLSGAGKSTLAMAARQRLLERDVRAYVLDGDHLRSGLNSDLDLSPAGRNENVRRVGEVAALFADAGFVCIVSLISPYRQARARARRAANAGEFFEVFVRADLRTCEGRDPKGLYARARRGEIRDMTGIDAPYETPEMPDLVIDTQHQTIEQSVESLLSFLWARLPGCIPVPRREVRWPVCRSVLMVGTDLSTRGGIPSVVKGYMEGGLFERFHCHYVCTHRDGGKATKIVAAFRGWLDVVRALRHMDAPLLHVHMSHGASFWRKSVVCLCALVARRPYVIHVHGSDFVPFFDEVCGPIARRVVRFVFGRSALVLALSDQWQQFLRRVCADVPVESLPNSVHLCSARQPLDRSRQPQRVLTVGQLGTRKGTFDLVRAFARIAADFPQAKLVCAGDGAIEDVRRLADALAIGDRIDLPGWIDADAVSRQLRDATAFVLPSYLEGMPMALLEAMSFGLPVIASRAGGIPDVIDDGRNGLLVDAGKIDELEAALRAVLSDSALSDRLGAAARHTIEADYSRDQRIEQLAAVYCRFGVRELA